MPDIQKRAVDKAVPYNADAESAVLGSILIDSESIFDTISFLGAADFFLNHHQLIYTAMLKIANRGESINQITVTEELGSDKKLEAIGGAQYLSDLIITLPTSIHIHSYAQIVKNNSIRRRLLSATGQIENLCYNENDPIKILSQTEQMLLNIQSDLAIPHLITPQKLAELGIEHYGNLRNPEHHTAISTGFEQLDFHTGGMFPSEYWILAARTGLGKSQIALQISQNAGRIAPVLFCPIEMHYKQMLDRMTAQKIGVNIRTIRAGGYDDNLMGNIYTIALPYISESNIYILALNNNAIDSPQFTISTISSMARHMKMAYGLGLIVIDYIGLIDADRDDSRASRAEQVSHISRGIKGIGNAMEVPVLAVAQINREPERRANRRPELSDLRDSGSLEQDADVVLFAYRDDYYDAEAENAGEAELHIAKQRQGESGIKLMMHWDKERSRYGEFQY